MHRQIFLAILLSSLFAVPAVADPPKPYTETIAGTKVTFDMVPIPGGTFQMGSPAKEKGRKKDEGPQRPVTVRPFFMGKHEVTWDAYHLFLDIGMKQALAAAAAATTSRTPSPTPRRPTPTRPSVWAGASRRTSRSPGTRPWSSRGGFPARRARATGCRPRPNGSTPAGPERRPPIAFGDQPGEAGDYAWFAGNAEKKPHVVGGKQPNASACSTSTATCRSG
jgi:hypothetical protein